MIWRVLVIAGGAAIILGILAKVMPLVVIGGGLVAVGAFLSPRR